MGRIVELPSIQSRSTSRRRGLRKLSPDLISKARDETATQVTRVGLTFLGTAAFCLLSLLTPDSALLGGNEKINVPGAGPVSFVGFMLLGPAVLIVLRVYPARRQPGQRRPARRQPERHPPERRQPERRPAERRRPAQRPPVRRPERRQAGQRRPEPGQPGPRQPDQRPPERRQPARRPPERHPPGRRRPERC